MQAGDEPLRIYIGSGEVSRIECQVLIYSLRKHSSRPLDISVINGTHSVVERDGEVRPLPLPWQLKRQQGDTEFGLARWLVPQLAGGGRALYLDSDIVCLTDIAALFALPLAGAQLMALPVPQPQPQPRWRTSVMPIDCSALRLDLEAVFAGIAAGRYSLGAFLSLEPDFLAAMPLRIAPLPAAWNALDSAPPGTGLLHFTDMLRQPWRHPGHPCGRIWFQYFHEARAAGLISDEELAQARRRGHVRKDIERGWNWRDRLARLSIPA